MSITYHVCKYTPTELPHRPGGPVRPAGRGPGELRPVRPGGPPQPVRLRQVGDPGGPGRAGGGAGAGQLLRHHPQRLRHPQGIRQPGLSLPAGHPPQPGGMFRPARPGPAPGPGGGLRGLQGHPVRPGGLLRRLPVPSPGHRAPHQPCWGPRWGPASSPWWRRPCPCRCENATCANNRRVAPPADQGDFAALMDGLRPLSAGPAALHAHDRQHRPPGPGTDTQPARG